jgi:LysM repeat protein
MSSLAVLLALAGGAGLHARVADEPARAAGTRPEYYVVRKADSFGTIAKRFGVSYRDLAEWNGISDPNKIRAGQRLRLTPPPPGEAGRAKPAAAAARAQQKLTPLGPAAQAATAQRPETELGAPGQKQEIEQLRATTGALIELLLSEGVITRDKAEELIQQAGLGPLPTAEQVAAAQAAEPSDAAQAPAFRESRRRPQAQAAEQQMVQAEEAEPGVVRVPYVPEIVKNEIRDQVREEVIAQAKAERWAEPSALPEWLDRIAWEGDIRLRYQGEFYQPENTPALIYNAITGSDLDNTTEDDEVFRYRARLGMLAKLSDTWGAGLRITSGNTTNPVSTNQSLGNYLNRGALTLDRVYLRWNQNERWLASAGRFANPFFSTDLLWDEDLTFEGAAATYKPRLTQDLSGFATAGAFLVQHQSSTPETPSPKTKWLHGLQLGTDWQWSKQGRLQLGVSYYAYANIEGVPNPTLNSHANDWTAPAFKQKGNTLLNIDNDGDPSTNLYALASKFELLNFTAAVDLAYFDPYIVRITGDYATNLGFDRDEIRSRTGLDIEGRTGAYSLGVLFGKHALSNFGDWQAFATYKYLEADSVLDAFTDSDFHLGGTDAKGYIVGVGFALDRNVALRLRWLSADEIDGPPLAIDVLQLDLTARF